MPKLTLNDLLLIQAVLVSYPNRTLAVVDMQAKITAMILMWVTDNV